MQDSKRLTKVKSMLPIFAVVVMIFTLYFHRLYGTRGPLSLVFNKAFYQTTRDNAFLWDDLVNKTPKDGSVMTQNHLAYIYTHQTSYILPTPKHINQIDIFKPKYIVLDFREGQNPNNYFPLTKEQTMEVMSVLLLTKEYKVIYEKGTMYILKRS